MKTYATLFVAAILSSGIAFAGDDNGGLNRDYWIPFSGNISAIQDKVAKNEAPTGSDILTSFEAVSWINGKTKDNVFFLDGHVDALDASKIKKDLYWSPRQNSAVMQKY